jgi:hypothetical protein
MDNRDKGMLKAVAAAIKEQDAKVFAAVMSRCDRLEERIKELEGRQLSYEGVWREDREYGKGAMTTHAGGIWHCEQACQGDMPGRSNAWRLAVKSGGK